MGHASEDKSDVDDLTTSATSLLGSQKPISMGEESCPSGQPIRELKCFWVPARSSPAWTTAAFAGSEPLFKRKFVIGSSTRLPNVDMRTVDRLRSLSESHLQVESIQTSYGNALFSAFLEGLNVDKFLNEYANRLPQKPEIQKDYADALFRCIAFTSGPLTSCTWVSVLGKRLMRIDPQDWTLKYAWVFATEHLKSAEHDAELLSLANQLTEYHSSNAHVYACLWYIYVFLGLEHPSNSQYDLHAISALTHWLKLAKPTGYNHFVQ